MNSPTIFLENWKRDNYDYRTSEILGDMQHEKNV